MDEKIKHRIVGVMVMAALLVIVIPALIKNVSLPRSETHLSQKKHAMMLPPADVFQPSTILPVSLEPPVDAQKSLSWVPSVSVVQAPAPVVKETQSTFCIQIATYTNAKNAELLVQRLKKRDIPPVKVELLSSSTGKKIQRVSTCGPMTPSDAKQLSQQLSQWLHTQVVIKRVS